MRVNDSRRLAAGLGEVACRGGVAAPSKRACCSVLAILVAGQAANGQSERVGVPLGSWRVGFTRRVPLGC